AILLAAFQNYNLQPGPTLLQTSGPLVWTLIASLYIGNVMLLVLNLPLIGIWVKVLRIPQPLLYGGISVFAGLGAYSLRQSWFDLLLLLTIGLAGLAMRRHQFPVAPVLIGMILGPMAEKQLRNALAIAQGDWTVFLTRPLSLVILCAIVAVLVLPRLAWLRREPTPLAR
ncbi:MAG: tripartite tricarboxylate transporter permease, partial [Burkholderiales bacterium]|nr:tripartite tricarboxylate transporter permease [Burkholderiales bacterium]